MSLISNCTSYTFKGVMILVLVERNANVHSFIPILVGTASLTLSEIHEGYEITRILGLTHVKIIINFL